MFKLNKHSWKQYLPKKYCPKNQNYKYSQNYPSTVRIIHVQTKQAQSELPKKSEFSSNIYLSAQHSLEPQNIWLPYSCTINPTLVLYKQNIWIPQLYSLCPGVMEVFQVKSKSIFTRETKYNVSSTKKSEGIKKYLTCTDLQFLRNWLPFNLLFQNIRAFTTELHLQNPYIVYQNQTNNQTWTAGRVEWEGKFKNIEHKIGENAKE